MPIAPGTRIGPYEILAPLGAGGMGEVYRARDSHLARDVAIKVLPAALSADHDYLARFKREAQVLASLNHPHIAAIYGLEEGAIVMELVEGQTLAQQIAAGPLPIDEALDIARQMAKALDAAHERGVIHRDLKPSNVKITPAGRVKLLDFGLAKSVQDPAADPDNSPTRTVDVSKAGVILGTAAYMSPEQARGFPVDRRTDIWAYGAVLYEMLTARRAFPGETVTDILAAVLKSEPDDSLLPPALPPRIAYLIKRCLRKKPADRLRDIGEARIWIDEAETAKQPPLPVPAERATGRWIAILATLAVGVLSGAVLWRSLSSTETRPWKGTFLGGPSHAIGPRISPDGKTLAFQTMVDGLLQVAVMKPESGNWTVLTSAREQGAVQEIAWSPDGTKLYFSRMVATPRGIYSVPVLGGEEKLVVENAANPEMLPDGSLVMVKIDSKRLFQIHHYWPETGKLDPLPAEIGLSDISVPLRVFPDGKEAAYFGRPLPNDTSTPEMLYALNLQTGQSRRLAPDLHIPPPRQGSGFPMAITADGRQVLLGLTQGDLRTLVAVPRTGNGSPETWLNFTQTMWYMDAGPDGSVYTDQVLERPEALRFSVKGGAPERLQRSVALGPIVQRADGSLLASAVFAGHTRVATGRPGGALTPVSETREDTDISITAAGEHAVAFPLGLPGKRVIAVASLPDGRIMRRLAVPRGILEILAGSPDGSRFFYVAGQKIWSIPSTGGEPTRIADGDSVSAGTGDLVVKLVVNNEIHLRRLPPSGGEPVTVPSSEIAALTDGPLSPAAVSPDGRVLVQVNEPHNWFYRMATVDLKTGRLDLIPADVGGDIWFPGWTPDGKIIATGLEYSFTLWQMRR